MMMMMVMMLILVFSLAFQTAFAAEPRASISRPFHLNLPFLNTTTQSSYKHKNNTLQYISLDHASETLRNQGASFASQTLPAYVDIMNLPLIGEHQGIRGAAGGQVGKCGTTWWCPLLSL